MIEQTAVVAGQPFIWRRKTTARATCPRCGTRVYAEPEGFPARSFSAYLLAPGLFRPTFHMRCQYALLPVQDGLPHFAGEPPTFGGSDTRVAW